jgi:hypothetical protein
MVGASYSPFDPFQSTENAHELNQSHRSGGAGLSGGYGHGRFRPRFSVVADDVHSHEVTNVEGAGVGFWLLHSSLG